MSDQKTRDAARTIAVQVQETAGKFESWIQKYPDLIPGSSDPLSNETASLRRRAKKIARACDRPMAVAVYGESQVGKSYLISNLAKGQNATVKISLGGQDYDFLKDINPGGGKESTGLVTRFSIAPARNTSLEKPVFIELLSELDIVSIFLRGYFGEIKHKHTKELSAEAIERVLGAAEASVAGNRHKCHHLTSDDIFEFKDYTLRYIEDRGKLRELNDDIWDRLSKVIPNLPTAERVKLYALLWLEESTLTAACLTLLVALEKLGFADAATVSVNALIPKESSIIDVQNMNGFANEEEVNLEVESANGNRMQIGKSRLCALTAEIYLPLSSPPGGVFGYCDLLDFPGLRPPENRDNLADWIAAEEKTGDDGIATLYLRGKVAFLFKRYTFDQELAAVLLCMKSEGNQNVHDLKGAIYDWIDITLGNSPKMRDQQANTLFVLFAKFDEVVGGEKPGEDAPANRLAIPVRNALVKFFSDNPKDNWPSQWDSRGVFQNCHWYRNPFAMPSNLFDYDPAQGVNFEVGINPEKKERIQKFKEAFLTTVELNRHFVAPEKAWDSVMAIQDGGVSHIAERLFATVNPSTKFDQLEGRIKELAIQLQTNMMRHHFSSDEKEEKKKRLDRAQSTLGVIANMVIANGMFGHMISSLQISSSDILYYLRKCMNQRHEDAEQGGPMGVSPDITSIIEIFDGPSQEVKAPVLLESLCAGALVERWTKYMQGIIGDEKMLRRLKLTSEQAHDLVDEIIRISQSQKIEQRIAELIREMPTGVGELEGYQMLSLLIADEFNSFIFYLGYDRRSPEGRPVIAKTGTPLFGRAQSVDRGFEVTEKREAFNQELYSSWIAAMWTRINEAADETLGGAQNQEANDLLKTYIDQLDEVISVR